MSRASLLARLPLYCSEECAIPTNTNASPPLELFRTCFVLCNTRAFPLLPAALASVSFGFVLVRVRVLLIASSCERARLWFMKRPEKRFPVNPKSSGLITFDSPGLVLSMQVIYNREKGILQFNQHNQKPGSGKLHY